MGLLGILALAVSLSEAAGPAAGGAKPADIWDELLARQEQFKTLIASTDAALAAMRAMRTEFPGSPDKAVLAARWEAAHQQCRLNLVRENDIRREHRSGLNVVKLELMARTVPLHGQARKDLDVATFSARLIEFEARAADMRLQAHRVSRDIDMESADFRAMVEYDNKRFAGGPLPWAAAALALAGGAAALAQRRSRSRTVAVEPVHAPPALAGRSVSRSNIELGDLLGRGAMGEVYAGRDRTLDRRVAVKRLRPELAGSPSELEKLVAQARQMAGLKHPNITQVHSVEREAGEAFLVLELAEGRTLAKLLADEGALPWEDARRVVRAVAEALDYAHVRGVLHSDLKPANVMVAPDGRVKVMDFALAYAAKTTVSRLTRSDAFGALPYMSPEQELGDPSPAADAYALAACFYEALTARRPFPGPDFLAQKRAGDFPPPSTTAKRLPAGTDSLFKIAFSKDPERRFSGPAALAAAADAL